MYLCITEGDSIRWKIWVIGRCGDVGGWLMVIR
jgi:hypothetical protein